MAKVKRAIVTDVRQSQNEIRRKDRQFYETQHRKLKTEHHNPHQNASADLRFSGRVIK